MEKYLLDQIIKKTLLIKEVLYPGYASLFLFDNASSYSIYIQNVLQLVYINKRLGSQQSF